MMVVDEIVLMMVKLCNIHHKGNTDRQSQYFPFKTTIVFSFLVRQCDDGYQVRSQCHGTRYWYGHGQGPGH